MKSFSNFISIIVIKMKKKMCWKFCLLDIFSILMHCIQTVNAKQIKQQANHHNYALNHTEALLVVVVMTLTGHTPIGWHGNDEC